MGGICYSSCMKKFFLSTFVIVVFTFYVVYQRLGGPKEVINPMPLSLPQTNQPSLQAVPTGISQVIPPTPQAAGQGFKDGEYIGSVADALYGNVQVAAVISGGKIIGVQFLQYPSDRRTSIVINTRAMPILKQEAVQVQSTQVDIVSGATQTSRAFRESLQSALNQAKN